MEDREPLLTLGRQQQSEENDSAGIRTYRTRWYILLVYCIFSTVQGAIWNNWGPLADSMKAAFGWNNTVLGLLPMWGPVTFLLTFYPWAIVLTRFGLRPSMILGAAFVLIGCSLKAIPFIPGQAFTLACHASSVLNGLAGPLGMAAGPKLAAEWFPIEERVTAVALATTSQSLGPTIAFLAGPLIVESPNATADDMGYSAIVHSLQQYNYIEAGVALLQLILVLVHFPNKPPQPPSKSSVLNRSTCSSDVALQRQSWLIIVAFSLVSGINGGFNAAFDLNVSQFGFGQREAGWIGFISALFGIGVGISASRIADFFRRPRMSLTNLFLMILASCSFMWFALQCESLIPSSSLQIYAATIVANSAVAGTYPFFFELACESAFPISEATVALQLTVGCNICSAIFLVILFFPAAGTRWMNFVMAAACAAAVPMLAAFKEQHRRRQIDLSSIDRAAVGSVQA